MWPRTAPGGNATVTRPPFLSGCRCGPGRGQRLGFEASLGRARGAPWRAVLGHWRAGHRDKRWPPRLRGGGLEGRGEQAAQTKNGAVPAALGFPAHPRRRGSRGPPASPPRSACASVVAGRFAATGQPCPSGPSGRDVGRGRVCFGRCPRCEPSRRGGDGDGRAGGSGRGRGWDTCGGDGGGGGARGFKKVWRGRARSQARPRGVAHTQAAALGGRTASSRRSPALPHARPRLRPRALAPAAQSNFGSRGLPPTSPQARELGAARLEPAAGSPSLRVALPCGWLQNWMSERAAARSAAAWSAAAGRRGLWSWPCCWWRRWGLARPPATTRASRPSFSCAPTTGSWKGTGSRARCSFPCTLRATPPTTYRDRNTMVGTTASLRATVARERIFLFYPFFPGASQPGTGQAPSTTGCAARGERTKLVENGVLTRDFNSPLTHPRMDWRLCDSPDKPWASLPSLTPSSCSCRTRASCFLNSSAWIGDFCPVLGPRSWVPRWSWGCHWAFQASCPQIGALWSMAAHAPQ